MHSADVLPLQRLCVANWKLHLLIRKGVGWRTSVMRGKQHMFLTLLSSITFNAWAVSVKVSVSFLWHQLVQVRGCEVEYQVYPIKSKGWMEDDVYTLPRSSRNPTLFQQRASRCIGIHLPPVPLTHGQIPHILAWRVKTMHDCWVRHSTDSPAVLFGADVFPEGSGQ